MVFVNKILLLLYEKKKQINHYERRFKTSCLCAALITRVWEAISRFTFKILFGNAAILSQTDPAMERKYAMCFSKRRDWQSALGALHCQVSYRLAEMCKHYFIQV